VQGYCILLIWKILLISRRIPTDLLRSQLICLGLCATVGFATSPVRAHTPTQNPAQKPAAKPPAQTPDAQPAVAGPQQTKHYPILVIAHGNEPFWSLRLGMKGPERLDRAGYPPIVLEPSDVARDESGTFWTYHAKDAATGALLSVKLVREPCSDGMSETQYTFKVIVDHPQIGTLNGCGQSAPDKFPEFRKKNQLDPDDNANADDKDKDKKGVLDPITNFKPPVAVAYLNATGRVVLSRGEIRKIVGPSGLELSLSHDGKKLLCTRSDSTNGPERSIVLYDADTGQTKDLVSGGVHQAFWSPDDLRIAFLKFDGQQWHVWTMPVAEPDKAAQLSPLEVTALHGWVSPGVVLATNAENAYWIGEDGNAQQTVPLKQIYGDQFQIMSSDTIRVNPVNSDLLLVSAYYLNAPAGAPVDAMGLASTFFLYEVRAKRGAVLGPPDAFARSAEWSRDGLQIFFTRGVPGKGLLVTNRIFWDGTGARKSESGSGLVIGK
jgi:uncharacterized membrane protein